MTTGGKRLTLHDLRRLNRMLQDYESGALFAPRAGRNSTRDAEGLSPFLLLEPFTVYPDAGEDPNATYGRMFSARCARLVPTDRPVQVLRQTPGRPIDQPFRLEFHGGSVTANLRCNMTTKQIFDELEKLPKLKGEIEIIGKGAEFGPDDDEVTFNATQWFLRFGEQFADGDLLRLDQVADNARLFVDHFWPSDSVQRVFFGLPGHPSDLSPGAFLWAQSVPRIGTMMITAECYHV